MVSPAPGTVVRASQATKTYFLAELHNDGVARCYFTPAIAIAAVREGI